MNLGQLARLSKQAFTSFRATWTKLPTTVKAAAVSAAATAIGASVSADNPDEAVAALAASFNNDGSGARALEAVTAGIATLPEKERQQTIFRIKADLSRADAEAFDEFLARTEARLSLTTHTGDGVKTDLQSEGATYDLMAARIAMVRRGMAILGVSSADDMRYLREVLFMDEEAFLAALARV